MMVGTFGWIDTALIKYDWKKQLEQKRKASSKKKAKQSTQRFGTMPLHTHVFFLFFPVLATVEAVKRNQISKSILAII
jgi:hypothetical protein